MGFYDYRCMVTGVSLKGAKTALVLLDRAGKEHRPITLAITGQYNRLGSIDHIAEDDNARLVLAYFLARLDDGALAVNKAELGGEPIDGIERLLELVERGVTMGEDTVVL